MFSKWCEVASCDGINDWYNARGSKPHFIFWSVVMIVMLGCSVWFTYRTIKVYIENPSVTNVGTVVKTPLEMPDVLLCYNGGLNAKKLKEANFSENFIFSFSIAMVTGKIDRSIHGEMAEKEFHHFLQISNVSVKQFISMFSFEFDEIFDSSNELCNTSTNCLRCDTYQTLILNIGKCFAFINNKPQHFPNVFSGMELRLKKPKTSVAEVFPNKILQLSSEYVISMEKNLGNQYSGRSLIVPSNSKTKIVLQTKKYKRLGSSAPCVTNEAAATSNTCFYNCSENTVTEHFGCTPFAFVIKQSTQNICNPFLIPIEQIPDEVRVKMGNCFNKCPKMCDEWLFEATMSSSIYENGNGRTLLLIGYETMQYIQYEEVESFTMDMAVSNVGGQSGLWLGLSMVTIVQAFYYMFLAICKRSKRSRTKPIEKPVIANYVTHRRPITGLPIMKSTYIS